MNAPPYRCPAPDCAWRPPGPEAPCPAHGLLSVDAVERVEVSPWLGHIIHGRYALLGYLGGGGHGAVYRGRDLRLGREVAIKLLNPSVVGSERLRRRFEREARLLSGLRSVHTLTAFDFGVADEKMAGIAYMVTELVTGPSLARRLKDGPLDAREWLLITAQIVRSLTEAHGQGIVHRDLKPGNILLARDPDGALETRVIDLGIARIEGEGQTTTGAVVGTPRYLAPEQCGVDGAEVDARTDIYALALVVWEMIVGHPAFRARSVVGLLTAKLTGAAPHLPDVEGDPRRARVDAVLQIALAREPQARFESADAFLQALREAADEAPDASAALDVTGTPVRLPGLPITLDDTPTVATGGARWRVAALLMLVLGVLALLAFSRFGGPPTGTAPGAPPPLDASVGGGIAAAAADASPRSSAAAGRTRDAAASPAMPDTPAAQPDTPPSPAEPPPPELPPPDPCPPADRGAIQALIDRQQCATARRQASRRARCRSAMVDALAACRPPPPPECLPGEITASLAAARAATTRGQCRKLRDALRQKCKKASVPSARSVCGECGDGVVQAFEICDDNADGQRGYCVRCAWRQ